MTQITNFKYYDLEERTLKFAKQTRHFVKTLPKSINNFEDSKQLIRSSGSIGANYIEANESLSKKDFIMRVKIAKKEAKETMFWFKLIDIGDHQELMKIRDDLVQETLELMKILGAIIEKTK